MNPTGSLTYFHRFFTIHSQAISYDQGDANETQRILSGFPISDYFLTLTYNPHLQRVISRRLRRPDPRRPGAVIV